MDPLQQHQFLQGVDRGYQNSGMLYNVSGLNINQQQQPRPTNGILQTMPIPPVRTQSASGNSMMGLNQSLGQDIHFMHTQQQSSLNIQRPNPVYGQPGNGLPLYPNQNNRPDITLMRRGTSESGANFESSIFPNSQASNPRFTNNQMNLSSSNGLGNISSISNQSLQQQHYPTHQTSLSPLQPSQTQIQQQIDEFVIQNEDFPALPRTSTQVIGNKNESLSGYGLGFGGSNLLNNNIGLTSSLNFNQSISTTNSNGDVSNQVMTGFGNVIKSFLTPAEASLATASGIGGSISTSNQSLSNTRPASNDSKILGKYGLLGLLDVLKIPEKETNILALGTDLTAFGLNLNSSESLYMSFVSPYAEENTNSEPKFTIPQCYQSFASPALKPENVSKFQIESLFYLFYMMPRDVMQVIGAQELYRRDWRYHSDLKLWFKARTPQELLQSHPNIQFIYFDVNAWEPRLFTSQYRGNIIAGLLSEEDIKIKSSNNSSFNSMPSNSLNTMGVAGNIS